MKKNDIYSKINMLNLDKEEFWVIGSASLVLRDILEDANDLDLAITKKEFDRINKDINLTYLGEKYNLKWYRINDDTEFCIDVKEKDKVDELSPYNLLNLKYYYDNHLKDSNRKKDIKKKELIKKMIGD